MKLSLKIRVGRGGGKSVCSTFFSFSFDLYHKGTLGKLKQGEMLELLAHTAPLLSRFITQAIPPGNGGSLNRHLESPEPRGERVGGELGQRDQLTSLLRKEIKSILAFFIVFIFIFIVGEEVVGLLSWKKVKYLVPS